MLMRMKLSFYVCLFIYIIKVAWNWIFTFLLCTQWYSKSTHEYFCEVHVHVLWTNSSIFRKWVLSTFSSTFQAISTQYLLKYWSSVLVLCLFGSHLYIVRESCSFCLKMTEWAEFVDFKCLTIYKLLCCCSVLKYTWDQQIQLIQYFFSIFDPVLMYM